MKLLILGPPGTGKGTQGKQLSKLLNLTYLSTGELFRQEYQNKTLLGLEAYSYWGNGNLVPDEVTIRFVHTFLPSDNFLLDGYPRTLKQAVLHEEKYSINKAIYLHTPNELLILRLLKRAELENRPDDTLLSIQNRLLIYEQETKPLLAFYKTKLLPIDGNKERHLVLEDILHHLRNI